MCLILFAYRAHPRYPLLVAANRDEFFDRPSAQAGFWTDAPQVLAGRDLIAGGTWLGVTTAGRFAAITNYRDPDLLAGQRSRGELTRGFLLSDHSPRTYAGQVVERGGEYAGFNLLVGGGDELFYCSNQSRQVVPLKPGVYGLSNHLLDTPWPKVQRGKQRLSYLLSEAPAAATLNSEQLLTLLADTGIAPDDALPDTGIGLNRERLLSPAFITGDNYGTRCSTALIIDRHGDVMFHERTFAQELAVLEDTVTSSNLPTALRQVVDEQVFRFSLGAA